MDEVRALEKAFNKVLCDSLSLSDYQLKGRDYRRIRYSAVLRGNCSPEMYVGAKIKKRIVDLHTAHLIVLEIKKSMKEGFLGFTHHGAILYEWFNSAEREFELLKRQSEKEQDMKFREANRLLDGSQSFAFKQLYDCLCIVSKYRATVLTPSMEKSWGDNRKLFYRSTDLSNKIANSPKNMEASWMMLAALKAIQLHLWQAMKFAKNNQLHDLSQVLYQIEKMDLNSLSVKRDGHELHALIKFIKPVKRIYAAIDDMFAHVMRKAFGVDYFCEQILPSNEEDYYCRSHLGNDKWSLLGCGVRTDSVYSTKAFHRLFKYETFDELVADIANFRNQAAS